MCNKQPPSERIKYIKLPECNASRRETYAGQELAIDDEEPLAADRYVHVQDLGQQLFLGVVHLLVVARPQRELLDVLDEVVFLREIDSRFDYLTLAKYAPVSLLENNKSDIR